MYFKELKQSLYLNNAYSIENLKIAYTHEEQAEEVKQKIEYSLVEIFEQLEKSGLCDSDLAKLPSENEFVLNFSDEEIDKWFKDAELKALIDKEKRLSQKRGFKQQASKSKQRNSDVNNIKIWKEIRKLEPKESFSQAYKIRYFKTSVWYFMDAYSNVLPGDENNLNNWKKVFLGLGTMNEIGKVGRLVFEIITCDREQLVSTSSCPQVIEFIVSFCKHLIKLNLQEVVKKTSFTSNDLVQLYFYGQVLSFVISINSKKQFRNRKLDSYEMEAISYIAYFLADGFISQKQPATINAVLFAKKGLKLSDFSDCQKAFNLLGVSSIDCGQRQLAYDTFFSWINRCVVGELKELLPPTFFQSDEEVAWRENEGKEATANMKGNFAYVCGNICDTYEPDSKRWKIFHDIALAQVSDAIKLAPKESGYHCTFGTLLSEDGEHSKSNLLKALTHFELYYRYNRKSADKLESLRVCCDTLLDILSESFVEQNEKAFFQWAEDLDIHCHFSNLNTSLKKYCEFQLKENTEDKELLKAQKSRKKWEPYFKLQEIVDEYKEIPGIQNLELLLMLIRNTVSLLRARLKRWEYNLTDYYTRMEDADQEITGRRQGIKPIAYYTTLNTVKFVFDDLYQEDYNRAPRKIKEGENGKNCLTVMHAKYMNDPQEGLPLIREFLSYIEKNGDENIIFASNSPISFREGVLNRQFVFLKSFTERIDNLVMWNRYASDYDADGKNSNGCCVQLDAEVFGQLVDSSSTIDGPIKLENAAEDDYYLYRVVYVSRDGIIREDDNPRLSPKVVKYYHALQVLIYTLNHYLTELEQTTGSRKENLIAYIRDFLQQTLNTIIFLFKDSDYSDELESRLIFIRTSNQQDEIRLLPTSPEKLCINPFFQVYFSQIMFGPNVREQELWIPYLQYQLNKMWRKHPSLADKSSVPPSAHYSIENSKIHYHT